MIAKITCPECGRILGDTDKSIDARINCRGCKKTVDIKIQITHCADYLNIKEEKTDDES